MHQAVTLQAPGWGWRPVPPSTPLAHGAVPAPALSTLRNLSLPATFTPSAPLPLPQRPYNIFISQQGFLFAILTLTGAKAAGGRRPGGHRPGGHGLPAAHPTRSWLLLEEPRHWKRQELPLKGLLQLLSAAGHGDSVGGFLKRPWEEERKELFFF